MGSLSRPLSRIVLTVRHLVLACASARSHAASGIQPGVTNLAAKPDDALRAAQVDEHLIVEERQNQRVAGRTDFFGLRQTPLRIVFEPRLCCRRLMIANG
ncbi:hypothetical protein P3T20_005084 [Paraburkholderia sp. GAS206C]